LYSAFLAILFWYNLLSSFPTAFIIPFTVQRQLGEPFLESRVLC